MTAIPTLVCGRRGRMCQQLARACEDADGIALQGRLSTRATDSKHGIFRHLGEAPEDPVVIDFTHPEQTRQLLRQALEVPCQLVIGTSGLEDDDHRLLAVVAERRPVLQAANFSRGLLLMTRALELLAGAVDDSWQAQVLDLHYAAKLDPVSATARHLAERWRVAAELTEPPAISTLRVGDGVSEHTLFLGGPGERLEIAHRVLDRGAFVASALDAVRFVHRRQPGLYSLADLYGI